MMYQKGMTLVELMVVVVITSIIGIAMVNMFTISNRTFMDQNKIIDVQRDGRLVMMYTARVLREVGLNPLNSPDFQGIREASLTGIRIDRDSDIDGNLDNATEIISLKFDVPRGVLMRGFNEGVGNVSWHDIANNITAFNLSYFDEDGAPAATLADIRAIGVAIDFQDSKFLGGDFTRSYSIRVVLRNL